MSRLLITGPSKKNKNKLLSFNTDSLNHTPDTPLATRGWLYREVQTLLLGYQVVVEIIQVRAAQVLSFSSTLAALAIPSLQWTWPRH